MAFLESFGDFGQSQMLTRVRQSINIQNSKIADLQSKIAGTINLKNRAIEELAKEYYRAGMLVIQMEQSGGGM